jgi:peptide-methionine (R)-S-oxide reductase
MKKILLIIPLFCFLSCKSSSQEKSGDEKTFEIVKTADEWKQELSDFEYKVIREKGTERAGTGSLLNNKEEGIYHCRACGLELFKSDSKFESGTGWPSFYEPYSDENIYQETDYKIGYPRSEIMCNRCGGHLGHVFNDGPKPTGLRYCVNSVSLSFEKK